MKSFMLEPGDVLFHKPTNALGQAICAFTGGEFSHVGQVLPDGRIAEMTFPKSRIVTLKEWWDENRPIYVCTLKVALTPKESARVAEWWKGHMGDLYDVPLLLRLASISLWQQFCWSSNWAWLRRMAKIQPATLGYVCSTAVATAFRYAGVPVDETSGMTPEDLEHQPIFNPVTQMEYAP